MTHGMTPRMKPRTTMRPPRSRHAAVQRGAATLIVVMLLFFIVSLVAAYAARNLIFEQKSSINQLRATQALEAAEAGLEWAVAMLNGGRIDASCTPLVPPDVSQNSFRQRYLSQDANGNYTPQLWAGVGSEREQASCVKAGAGWNCSCPDGVRPAPTLPGGTGINPAFRVCFEALTPAQPGAVRVVSTGRTAFLDQSCDAPAEGSGGDAAASVSVVVALSSALAASPGAAVTATGGVTSTGGLTLVNTDALSNGITAHLGGPLVGVPSSQLLSLPGTPGLASAVPDNLLGARTPEEVFKSVFRMGSATFSRQPAAVTCASPCSTQLQELVNANPRRIVWVDGNLVVTTPVAPNAGDPPALIVAAGNVTITATTQIRGVLVALGNLTSASNLDVQGAVVVTGNLADASGGTIEFDPAVLRELRMSSGSLVRVPGSWRDFP